MPIVPLWLKKWGINQSTCQVAELLLPLLEFLILVLLLFQMYSKMLNESLK